MILLDEILCVINRVTEVPLTLDQVDVDLDDMGIDSVLFVRIILELEIEYDIIILDDRYPFSETKTIREIYHYMLTLVDCL